MAREFNKILLDPKLTPEWMTRGRTTLIHKKGPTDEARNYRPITCLPTYYKFITLILTDKIYKHVCDNDILPFEQKGIRRKSRGCKDHLLLDKFICEEAKRKKRNLSMMWIDYKKAYDSVPHTWLTKILTLYKIDSTTSNFIISLMPQWKTKMILPFKDGCVSIKDININRGIFQGDYLSPLLFCIALIPIANILKRAKTGFKVENKKINHLLYIDDLKVYSNDEEEMERCKNLIQEFSKDIGMEFGLDKCATIHLKKGEVKNSPLIEEIPQMTCDDRYKYLGVLQCDTIASNEVKENTKREYFRRVRAILKSDVSAINVAKAINTFLCRR